MMKLQKKENEVEFENVYAKECYELMNINIEAKENEEDLIAINNIDISNDNKKKKKNFIKYLKPYTQIDYIQSKVNRDDCKSGWPNCSHLI